MPPPEREFLALNVLRKREAFGIPISIPYKDIAEITYFAFDAFIGTKQGIDVANYTINKAKVDGAN